MKQIIQTSQPRHRNSLSAKALQVVALAALAAVSTVVPTHTALASSHSDAPLIKLDPQANLTDVYAFVRARPTGEKVLVVSVSVHPFCEPGDGVMYDAFSPDVLYSIHIANPVTGADVQRYDFRFSPVTAEGGALGGKYKNKQTILRYGLGTELGPIQTVGDNRQNFIQNYLVFKEENGTSTLLNGDLKLTIAPPNVGKNTTPLYNDVNGVAVSGAATLDTLDPYTRQATYNLPGGTTVFVGPREDGFYADAPAIFDLLDGRILDNNGNGGDGLGQDGKGVDGFKGYNVMQYSIVIPLSQLPSFTYTGALQPAGQGVGVYASVSRPAVTMRSASKPDTVSGEFVQVNRLANPLFNEGLVALIDKDKYNRSKPVGDQSFAKYALNPELAVLLNTVFGTAFPTTGREDLKAIYIPDVIRVNTTTGPVPVAGDMAFNRLSFIGNDTVANGTGDQIPAGWPNGRRFGDDVVDIALTTIASGPGFTAITVVGDNVSSNDQLYNRTFPYAATPHAGTRNSKDSGVNLNP